MKLANDSNAARIFRAFLLLWVFTAIGIFLHELGHHLLGIPSEMSLSRNWPLVPVTAENRDSEIVGTLAGPTINIILGYAGVLLYTLSSHEGPLRTTGFFGGLANSFIVLMATIVNLIVDLVSGSNNDLQEVSKLMGINILILPLIYTILSVPPLLIFWSRRESITDKKVTFIGLLLIAWIVGGTSLMLLDTIFNIRFRIV